MPWKKHSCFFHGIYYFHKQFTSLRPIRHETRQENRALLVDGDLQFSWQFQCSSCLLGVRAFHQSD